MKRNLQALNQNNTKNLSASRRMSVGAANVRVVEQDNFNKMIDQFFIFGAPPDRSSNMCPTLLTMFPSTNYPQTDEDLAKITKLCFLNSFQPISENLSPNQVIINEFVFFIDQKRNSNFNHTYNSIECEVNRTYGIVVQFKAPADMTPFFSSNSSRKYPFALCILTHTHFLSSHFQFATFLALFLTGKIQSTQQHKQLRAPLPVRGFCHPSLTLDKETPAIAVFPGFISPISLTDVLAKYVSRPTNPQNTPFFDMQYAELVPMAIPLNLSMNQCISHPCFDVLFSQFLINDIVQIYSSILLEKKIAFVSQDPHKSSLCVIACASLMRPFKVTSTIIPVFIDSNTNNFTGSNDNLLNKSFIIGTTNSNIGADLIADVSTGVLSMKIPQQLVIPRSSEIIRKINLVIQNRINDITVPPVEVRSFLGRPGSNPKYDEFFKNVEPFVFPPYYTYYFPQKYIYPTALIDSIREIFASHIAFELNDKIKVCIVKNKNTNIDELNKQMFLKQFNLEESLFIIQFIETGVFTDFYERSQQQMNKKPIPLFRASSYTTYTKYNMVSNATDALSPFANDANDNSIHE